MTRPRKKVLYYFLTKQKWLGNIWDNKKRKMDFAKAEVSASQITADHFTMVFLSRPMNSNVGQ